jgi:hypothetical protein
MIVMQTPIVYSPPMDLLTVAFVSLLNKKEDLVVETRTRNIKSNVILHVNVDILMMTILYLEHVKNHPLIQINQIRQIVTPMVKTLV